MSTRTKGLVAALTVSAVTFGSASGAAGMSLDEFFGLNTLEKENFMTTVLHYFHNRYSQDPATTHKAECMVDLYNPAVAGAEPRLLVLIEQDMHRARAEPAKKATVERIVQTVVERECRVR